MVATRRGVRVSHPSETNPEEAAEAQATPSTARRTRRTVKADSPTQHTLLETCCHLEDAAPESPSTTRRRCTRASRLHSPELPSTPMGSTHEADVSDVESCCSVVSNLELTQPRTRGTLTRRRTRQTQPGAVSQEDEEVSEVESCSSAVSVSKPRQNTRRSTRRKTAPVASEPTEAVDVKLDRALETESSSALVSESQRVTRSQQELARGRSPSNLLPEDSELSDADSCASSVSAADVSKSSTRRSARTRKQKLSIPFQLDEPTEGSQSPAPTSRRTRSTRGKATASADASEPLSCDSEGFESGPTYSRPTSRRGRTRSSGPRALDSESELTDVHSLIGSTRGRGTPCSSRTGSGSSSRSAPTTRSTARDCAVVQETEAEPAEQSLEESRLEDTVIAADADCTLLEEETPPISEEEPATMADPPSGDAKTEEIIIISEDNSNASLAVADSPGCAAEDVSEAAVTSRDQQEEPPAEEPAASEMEEETVSPSQPAETSSSVTVTFEQEEKQEEEEEENKEKDVADKEEKEEDIADEEEKEEKKKEEDIADEEEKEEEKKKEDIADEEEKEEEEKKKEDIADEEEKEEEEEKKKEEAIVDEEEKEEDIADEEEKEEEEKKDIADEEEKEEEEKKKEEAIVDEEEKEEAIVDEEEEEKKEEDVTDGEKEEEEADEEKKKEDVADEEKEEEEAVVKARPDVEEEVKGDAQQVVELRAEAVQETPSQQSEPEPQPSKTISLLDSSDDDEEEEEQEEVEEEVEGSEEEEKAGPSKRPKVAAASMEGLFMIDTRPGLEADEQYYKEGPAEEEEEEPATSRGEEQEDEEDEEFVDEEGSDDEEDEDEKVLFSTRNSQMAEWSTRIDPGLSVKELGGLYISFDGNKPKPSQQLKGKSVLDEMMKKSVVIPDFAKKGAVPPYSESKKALKRKHRAEREKTTGDGWFNMKAPEVTQELKGDLQVLQMRGSLDPKRFYKKNDRDGFPKYFQVGTVVDSPVDFYHSRVPKKERKRTMVEELLADAEFRQNNKRKYKNLLTERAAQTAGRKKKNKFHRK